jgi:hypothetical protein
MGTTAGKHASLTDCITGLFIHNVCKENFVFASVPQKIMGLQYFGTLCLVNIGNSYLNRLIYHTYQVTSDTPWR